MTGPASHDAALYPATRDSRVIGIGLRPETTTTAVVERAHDVVTKPGERLAG
jgi:hypothetical protein